MISALRARLIPAALRQPSAILADRSLRYERLNHAVNETYNQYAERFQAILDPQFTPRRATSDVAPSWFAFASYSSKGGGQGELLCKAGLDVLDGAQRSREARLQTLPPLASWLKPGLHLMDAVGLGASAAAEHFKYLPALNSKAYLRASTALKSVDLLREATVKCPDTAPVRGALTTLRNTLEDANRAIFADLGAAGHSYLQWRGEGLVHPGRVLEQWSCETSRPEEAKALYTRALETCQTAVPNRLREVAPPPGFDTASLVPAAFALFEHAGRAPGPYAQRLIECANNMLLYREQSHVVQPVFDRGAGVGELDRKLIMHAATPSVRLTLGRHDWDLTAYAARQGKPATDYNWADLHQRWDPIMDALQHGYRFPRQMWPLPDPDPAVMEPPGRASILD